MNAPTSSHPGAAFHAEPGSFRDPESRVFYAGDAVYRALSAAGLADYEAVTNTAFYDAAQDDGRIVATELVPEADAPPGVLVEEPAGVLRHERIPFVSYPYEWPFSMLKDAALLQLDLLEGALEEGLTLKDASPYNVQFRGARPVFVDVGSFERRRAGETWVGRRQFCMLFLYPLMLQAVKGIPFQPWLRGQIDGIPPEQMRSLCSFRDRFRRGFPTNVFVAARLERAYADRAGEVKADLDRLEIGREVLLANVRKMRTIVNGLTWSPPQGVWVDYGERTSYTDADTERKEAFVRQAVAARHRSLTWDVGANHGRYARIAAEGSDTVVAIDADQGPIELLYRSLRDEGTENIVPLAMDLADPSPALGWRGAERKALEERGRPDLVLALALVHHIAITANVPVAEFVAWLASLDAEVVVEFPTREDPMVQKLLSGKRDGLHADYERGNFERLMAEHFNVERHERLASGTRLLYHARPAGGGAATLAAGG